jgi:hypothetical protein
MQRAGGGGDRAEGEGPDLQGIDPTWVRHFSQEATQDPGVFASRATAAATEVDLDEVGPDDRRPRRRHPGEGLNRDPWPKAIKEVSRLGRSVF